MSRLSTTLADVNIWMACSRLKMNDDKSEFIVYGSKGLLPTCFTSEIDVGDVPVSRSQCVKLLGVYLDQNLTFKSHISSKARAASFAMYNLKKIKPYLDQPMCLKIANALIFSHMDYSNSLLINLPASTLRPLQRIQNFTAKSILGKTRRDSATEALQQLHILPVRVRSEFKILVLVYKCIHDMAPAYLAEKLSAKQSSYSTRSAGKQLLNVPRTSHKTFADRSFSVAGPTLWNALPEAVKNEQSLSCFKKHLKTYLFGRTFGSS